MTILRGEFYTTIPQKRRNKTWGKYIESVWSFAVLDVLDVCQDINWQLFQRKREKERDMLKKRGFFLLVEDQLFLVQRKWENWKN